VAYKLAIGEIMNGLPSKLSSTVLLPLGQKMGPGAIAPLYICSPTIRPQGTYQNRFALDYLLASEGGVCEKFNLSNCCLQIDDKEKVTKKKSQTK
jgi:hypothetical protein